jgi:hypothetical protein
MKRRIFGLGMPVVLLALGLVFAGCSNPSGGGGGGPAKYTVTFAVNGGTLASGDLEQEVEDGKTAAAPTVTPPANKEADGWDSSVASIASPASPITADVTFTAKWKDKAAAKYAVTFAVNGGTLASGDLEQEVESGKTAAIPTVTPPANKEADGWDSSVAAIASPASPITADVTFTAKWKDVNPFIGVWVDYKEALHYKFADTGGTKVYSTATGNTFNAVGTYEYDTTELTLRPTGGSPIIKKYEITDSLLTLNKDETDPGWYTKNPETGGGFNGDAGVAPIGGMWQSDSGSTLGFNNAGEFFRPNGTKSRDNKVWWDVHGTYDYNSTRKELTLRRNGIVNGQILPEIYTAVTFKTADQVMDLTDSNGTIITFNKRDGDL